MSSNADTLKSYRIKKILLNRSLPNGLKKRVTLLYGAKDEQHNNAVVLKEFIERKIKVERGQEKR
jgi:uncharacterized protein YeaO (DUF488 family)